MDGSGGIYVTDTGTGRGDGRVLKLAAGSTTQIVLPFTGETDWVALNAAEDVFFSQFLGSRVMMLAGGSNSATALPFTDLYDPSGVAVDTTGTVYVADSGNARVLKLVAGSTTQTELPFTGISGPTGVAIDTAGNVYVADTDHGRVLSWRPDRRDLGPVDDMEVWAGAPLTCGRGLPTGNESWPVEPQDVGGCSLTDHAVHARGIRWTLSRRRAVPVNGKGPVLSFAARRVARPITSCTGTSTQFRIRSFIPLLTWTGLPLPPVTTVHQDPDG